jgi:hypothetical protein
MVGEPGRAGVRVIAPSRFGYFGSTLPTDASPADQADAYALLLDHLGVDRVASRLGRRRCSNSHVATPAAPVG